MTSRLVNTAYVRKDSTTSRVSPYTSFVYLKTKQLSSSLHNLVNITNERALEVRFSHNWSEALDE